MRRSNWIALAWLAGFGWMTWNIATASAEDGKPAAAPQFKLPEGWTAEDLQACMQAGTPGEMHKHIAGQAGKWTGKQTMWMAPGVEPSTSECTSTCATVLDGRFMKVDFAGEVPGMGPYQGLGIVGYDNVSKKFQSIWLDNHGTGMMVGTGKLSADGKSLTWKYDYTCPITKKPTTMREIETFTSPDSKTLEMFSTDPKSGKEFQMMKIELKRTSADQASR